MIKLFLFMLQSNLGRIFWNALLKKYCIDDNELVVLCPTKDSEINKSVVEFAPDRVAIPDGFKKISVFYTESSFPLVEKPDCVTRIQCIPKYMSNRILDLCVYYQFDERLIIASIHHPEGRLTYRLLGHNGSTSRGLFLAAVYNIPTELIKDL